MRTPKIEEVLDQAIRRIHNGENISTVVSDYPENLRENLYDLLALSKLAFELPKRKYPTPIKRKLYLDVPKQNLSLFRFLFMARSVYPIVFVLLIASITGTVSAAMQSLPGDKLFTVKKALQSAEIKLATNPEKKAELQLNLFASRIEEAQTVIANNTETNPAKDAAIIELNKQTEVALKNIQEIASTEVVTKNPELLKKAEHLTEQKRKVLASVDPIAAKEKNTAHESTIASIKQIIATVNDQTVAALTSNKIAVTSTVESIKGKSLKIEKNTFEIKEETLIEDGKGNKLALNEIAANDTVEVAGVITDEITVAEKITLITKAKIVEKPIIAKPVVKAPVAVSTPLLTSPTSPEKPALEEGADPAVPEEKPQDTYTGFILELPNK